MNTPRVERYRYFRQGFRGVKSRSDSQKNQHQVRYLNGLELRSSGHSAAVIQAITLHAMRIMQRKGGESGIRFSSYDCCNSLNLELDEQGNILNREGFYPFGGTALWLTRSQRNAEDKICRYGGKERDITGLSYYGFRCYVPWLLRWLNPDPAETVDGLNLLIFTGNNPLTWQDPLGLARNRGVQPRYNYQCSGCGDWVPYRVKKHHERFCVPGEEADCAQTVAPVKDEITEPAALTQARSATVAMANKFDAAVNEVIATEGQNAQALTSKPVLELNRFSPLVPDKITRLYHCNFNSECNRRFKVKYKLKEHLILHQNLAIYPCTMPDCGKKFVLKRYVQQHIKTHTAPALPKIHPCPQCGQRFSRKPNLKQHVEYIHNGKKRPPTLRPRHQQSSGLNPGTSQSGSGVGLKNVGQGSVRK